MGGLILSSVAFGVALAMDAFSVSLANGLNEPCMKKRKMLGIAGIFAIFQGIMPLIGYILIKVAEHYFSWFKPLIPWIALILLGIIGGKMIYEGITSDSDCPCSQTGLGFGALIVQGIATSIDALSAGVDMEKYIFPHALVAVVIIAVLTFAICLAGIIIGRKGGSIMAGKAGILGGAILVIIGLEIFIGSFFK